jgi:serine kinase of HPr protein (carbohydrate metabolism regulator)
MIRLHDIIENLNLEVKSAKDHLDREVTGGYASDLLSDVMANSKAGNVWVTLQLHTNIVAVATLKELSAVIIVNGRMPEPETLRKAEQEKIPILISKLPTFEVVGRLYQLVL